MLISPKALHELSLPPTCLSFAPRDSYSPSYAGFLAALRHILLLGLCTSCSFPESQATDILKAISLTSGLWSSAAHFDPSNIATATLGFPYFFLYGLYLHPITVKKIPRSVSPDESRRAGFWLSSTWDTAA